MNKKWATKRITVNLASTETEKLEKYCAITGRPATDVIRELIRSLPVSQAEVSQSSQAISTNSLAHTAVS
ncbi:CopG family transcriptional regulator [Nostoc minutum NIES-26]|uniref:CopG family transcriptional regulator n=1 Tax=Nostoc minutum NIES-26 TaxID=1844469 RepID=A0A367RFS6_9NOSO|nr:CopG family transcriptional regulator [Dendronalium sp. ChiSLP03b]MDZ8208017.1 CopG family transcriptional regulator [Dendronalium sp. ChiSLP03b]RCJ35397.1 CopG family transcriptional regulator [Nostoc minutum NIES-26]